MQVVALDRRKGKTVAALHWLADDPENRVLLTFSEIQVKSLVNTLMQFGVYATVRDARQHVQVFDSAVKNLRGRKVQVAIDNADIVLQGMLYGLSLELITVTVP